MAKSDIQITATTSMNMAPGEGKPRLTWHEERSVVQLSEPGRLPGGRGIASDMKDQLKKISFSLS